MAESAKRKSDAIKERIEITAFSRPEASDLPQTSQFFAAIRRVYLDKALKRAKLAEAEAKELTTDRLELVESGATVLPEYVQNGC